MSAPRVLIVSNRLPVGIATDAGTGALTPSTGTLATALREPHQRSGGLWIGWPGNSEPLAPADRQSVTRQLADLRAVPIWLQPDEVARFNEGFARQVLWPLFHYRVDRLPLAVDDWASYEQVNQRFAEAVAAHHQPGDLVWVHDYHLMRVPHLLRRMLPAARIGFFLHIPFPSSEVFRTVPNREQLLEGLLGADLIGFHTPGYMRHFTSAVLRTFGLATDIDRLRVGDRDVSVGAFPMGIDAASFAALAAAPAVAAEMSALRGNDPCAVLVGIDALDDTKGIPRRLVAFEALLHERPDLRERVRLIQVAAPSHTGVEARQGFRQDVEALVGRVNGSFGTPQWTPVHAIFRALSPAETVALYRAADVMVVTPVRDGMTLVAKEFVAARVDEDGVLVLSEFAGAASELAEALQVNPYDVRQTADTIAAALALPASERRTRMQGLRKRVLSYDVHRWARTFLDTLATVSAQRPAPAQFTPDAAMARVARRMRDAAHLLLLLDYDGTLVPYAGVPELAAPDFALLELLAALAARRGTTVHVVSGRPRESVVRWLGALPIGLHAEHGYWSRDTPDVQWRALTTPSTHWRPRVHAILEHFSERTPGSLIEEKTASLAWHYRMADPEYGERQANELRLHLSELLSNAPVEILPGEKIIEIRPYGISKRGVAERLIAAAPPGTVAAAFGDDRTDEDLFAALPEDGISVHVGPRPSRAAYRVADVDAARRILRAILA